MKPTSQTRARGIEIAVIMVLFFVSVVIRAPEFNRPLGDTHEWQTAHATITQQLWTNGGWKRSWFSPIVTFPGGANKFVPYFGHPINTTGEAYYISYPPFLFIAPFVVTQLLGAYPTVATTEGFNLFLHLLGAFALVFLLKMIMPVARGALNVAALAGGALFLFLPGNLWNFQNSYFSNTLALVFFIAGIVLFVQIEKLIRAGTFISRSHYVALGVLTFFFVYTDWLAIFWATAFVFHISFMYTIRRSRNLTLVIVLGGFLALLLTAYQYGQVVPTKDILHTLFLRGVERSSYDLSEIARILVHYSWYYMPLAAALFFGMFSSRRTGFRSLLTSDQKSALFISLFPVLLQHFFLPQFSAEHSFSVLIASPFLIIVFLIMTRQHVERGEEKKTLDRNVLIGVVAMIFFASALFLYRGHFTREHFIARRLSFERLGTALQRGIGNDEIAFIYNDSASQGICLSPPQLMYYARRNIKCITSYDDARIFIKDMRDKTGIHKGAIIFFDRNFTLKTIDHILVDEEYK